MFPPDSVRLANLMSLKGYSVIIGTSLFTTEFDVKLVYFFKLLRFFKVGYDRFEVISYVN